MGYEGRDYRRSRGQNYAYGDRDSRGGYSNRPSGYDYEDRGFFDRAGDEVRSWFGDEEAERRRRWDEREAERHYEREGNRWPSAYGRDDQARGGYGSGGYWLSSPSANYQTGGYRDTGNARSGRDYYAPYRGDTYRENATSGPHDPRYHEWRSREIEMLDRDYDDYRRENQSRFDNDFGTWRSARQGQRQSLNNVREHQEVVGSDGEHVGKVDHVRGDRIILAKNDQSAGGRHHSIPCGWIREVGDTVVLNRSAADAQKAWKDEERRGAFDRWDEDPDGPHILNRSFAGTY